MRRREFISVLGYAVAWPLSGRAQQSSMPVVAFLADGTPEGFAPRLEAVRRGLSDLGFADGRDFALVSRWARGN
jgi:putative tryptophan/tyrosine transport system substrate-binding protein